MRGAVRVARLWLSDVVLLASPAWAQMEGDLEPWYGDASAPGRQIAFFDIGGSYNDVALGGAVDPAGRVVLVGYVETGDATYPYAIGVARLTTEGQTDMSFGSAGLPGGFLLDLAGSQEMPGRSVAIEPDGFIVVAGTRASGVVAGVFARIRSDGTAFSGTPVNFILPAAPLALPPNVRGGWCLRIWKQRGQQRRLHRPPQLRFRPRFRVRR